MTHNKIQFPKEGQTKEAVLTKMKDAREHDIQWRNNRAFGLVTSQRKYWGQFPNLFYNRV